MTDKKTDARMVKRGRARSRIGLQAKFVLFVSGSLFLFASVFSFINIPTEPEAVNQSLLFTAVYVLLGTIISIRLVSKITTPLRKIIDGTKAVSSGGFIKIRDVQASDELQDLVQSFNDMIESLQKSRDRIQANEETLRQREEEIRLIIETAHDAVVTMDEAASITSWNLQAEKIFGWSREQAVGKQLLATIVSPKSHEVHGRGFDYFLYPRTRESTNEEIELTGVHRDGHEFPIEMSVSHSKSGDSIVYTAFLRDIAERKQVEIELREAKESAELANRDLVHSNEELKKATIYANELVIEAELSNSAKSEFLANMSHEIRTPMNAVMGMTGLLLDTDLNSEQQDYAETVQRAADSLLTIVNDILDFSKIDAGKLDVEAIPFDLRVAIEDVVDVLVEKAHKKEIELMMRYAPDAPHRVIGDPGRIRQVLTNLTNNAIKFTRKGHVFIDIEPVEQTGDAVIFKISVQDTGIGITADKLDHIFGKFTQADSSTTRQYGGTGLGLAISKKLVMLMGGTMEVASQVQKGSTFSFTLSLPIDPYPPEEPKPRAELTGVRVLVLDNNDINRRILLEQSCSWGMRCQEVASVGEAFAVLHEAVEDDDPFEILITDYKLLGMSGKTFGRIIKADQKLQDTVLVMLSSMAQRGDCLPLQEIGFAAYLAKPVHESQLLDVLVTVWSAKKNGAKLDLVTRHTVAEFQASTPIAAPPSSLGSDKRVLLVEDNIDNQRLAARLLEKIGCHVDVAANGKEAVEMIETFPYHMAFMDCQMPEMDGYEAAAEIRRRENSDQHLPIIAMTANAMQGDRERCLEAGMDDYVAKPISKKAVIQVVERWTDSSETQAVVLTDP